MAVQLPQPKNRLPCFGPGFRTIPLLLFTPQKQKGWYGKTGIWISLSLWGWCGARDRFSADCLHDNELSVVCHISELVIENLMPRRISRASRRAVFLASSSPQWARPCQCRPAISTASFRHLAPPNMSQKGTFKLIHLANVKKKKNWNHVKRDFQHVCQKINATEFQFIQNEK